MVSFKYLGAKTFGPPMEVLEFGTLDTLPSTTNDDDILIRVEFAELNPVDLQKLQAQKSGLDVPEPPLVIGYGGSGTIVSLHDAKSSSHLKVGDSVIFLADPRRSKGAFASHVVVDRQCVAKVDSISLEQAASIPLAGCTAYESLEKLSLDGKNVSNLLIVGGAGGVGSWATLLARAQYPNLEIITTSSSEASRSWCLSMGASRCLPSHNQLSTQQGLEGGRNGSIDRILCLTEPTPEVWNDLTEIIRPYGKICLVVAGKSIQTLDLGFCFFKSVTILTETMFASQRSNFALVSPADEMAAILKLLSTGQIPQTPQSKESPVVSWNDALKEGGVLDQLASGHTRGKMVMKID
mmetsp:Transcript_22050/g.32581  ORF Transcript_22050/g.32581 Transcript_22050/m.32581 type:complete len:352 (-) Transcript_22050:35-1090(-)